MEKVDRSTIDTWRCCQLPSRYAASLIKESMLRINFLDDAAELIEKVKQFGWMHVVKGMLVE
jgi:hypothetical protein